MPLYEYECPKCGTFERMQKFSDPVLKRCPTCDSPVEKLLSAPAIQFKGSGWYVTDYARKSPGKEGGEKGSKDAGGAKDSSGSDSAGSKDTKASSTSKTPGKS